MERPMKPDDVEIQLLLMDLKKSLARLDYNKLHLLYLEFLRIEVENKLKKMNTETKICGNCNELDRNLMWCGKKKAHVTLDGPACRSWNQ
jgi:translation initiation factor 2 beta subunit (eIF-2beta)/eIF-5